MTRVSQHVAAPPDAVWAALTDGADVARWMVPDDMTSEVHAYDARVGGRFAITLTYADERAGKTSGRSDSFHGRFVRLEPGRELVQVVEFDTDDPSVQGDMTISYRLTPDGDGTVVEGVHEGLPAGVDEADNELGWRMSLAKLARLVEGRQAGP